MYQTYLLWGWPDRFDTERCKGELLELEKKKDAEDRRRMDEADQVVAALSDRKSVATLGRWALGYYRTWYSEEVSLARYPRGYIYMTETHSICGSRADGDGWRGVSMASVCT